MGKQLLLVGGGHAHMMTLAALHRFIEKGHGVTVIGPSAYHYYSGMGPGMLGKTYTPEDIRFATQRLVEAQGGQFILGKAARVDPDHKMVSLESGQEVPYDVVSFNAGSHIPPLDAQGDTTNIYSVKPFYKRLRRSLLQYNGFSRRRKKINFFLLTVFVNMFKCMSKIFMPFN